MIKVCVTGNKGFIGKEVQRELERSGKIVVGIEKWIFERDNWQKNLNEYLSGINPDVVFHIGACSNTQNQNVSEMLKMNTESTFIIADWCKAKNIPLIYSSSASVVGSKGEPETLYAWSKYLGERYVINCGGVALRYFNVYGSYEYDKGKMASIACQAYNKWKFGERMLLFPQRPTRDFVYIKDVVSANLFAWENYEQLKANWYDVGTGESRAFEDVLNIMNIPFDHVVDAYIPPNYQFFTQADPNRFMSGWTPKFNLEEGLKQYLIDLKVTMYHPHL
jgi:ADP-L-glycero-D-manno-heptose 6-epimerase